jgi:hypothetical protein
MDARCAFSDPRPLLLPRIPLVFSSSMLLFEFSLLGSPFFDLEQRASFGAYSSRAIRALFQGVLSWLDIGSSFGFFKK